jgi:hypothetical protein
LGEIAVAGLPGRSPASVVFTGVDQVTPWSVEGDQLSRFGSVVIGSTVNYGADAGLPHSAVQQLSRHRGRIM